MATRGSSSEAAKGVNVDNWVPASKDKSGIRLMVQKANIGKDTQHTRGNRDSVCDRRIDKKCINGPARRVDTLDNGARGSHKKDRKIDSLHGKAGWLCVSRDDVSTLTTCLD